MGFSQQGLRICMRPRWDFLLLREDLNRNKKLFFNSQNDSSILSRFWRSWWKVNSPATRIFAIHAALQNNPGCQNTLCLDGMALPNGQYHQ